MMPHTKAKKTSAKTTQASVTKEMAKPRITNSARIADQNLDSTRIQEQPSVIMPGTVKKIIPSTSPSQPEKAQVAVNEAAPHHRDLRFENTLTDENGDDVKLKKGEHVDVTITSEHEGIKSHEDPR